MSSTETKTEIKVIEKPETKVEKQPIKITADYGDYVFGIDENGDLIVQFRNTPTAKLIRNVIG